MNPPIQNRMRFLLRSLLRGDDASQIVEFALSLPLLVVFTIGIFDFSGAYTLKQKLGNAARDCARSVAGAPAGDVGTVALPAAVFDGKDVVANYLENSKVNDCGLRTAAAPAASGLTWTYTATGNGCPGSGLTLIINRGCVFPAANPGNVNVVGTCVQLQYTYQWQFNRVIALVSPGASYASFSTLNATAVAMNEN